MKIRFLIVSLFVLCAIAVEAQKKKKDQPVQPPTTEAVPEKKAEAKPDSVGQRQFQIPNLSQHYARKYAAAIQWNDYDVAKDALYSLIVENPANDSLITDLAVFYLQNQKYPSAVLVAQELLSRNPKNTEALEVSATGYESLGVMDRALQNYESMYLLQNNVAVLYKMAFLQYQLKRYKEATTSSDILLASKDIEGIKASFNDAQNKAKEYPLKVAILNLKGMIARDENDKVNAKKYFNEALAMAPDFLPAKQNLTELK